MPTRTLAVSYADFITLLFAFLCPVRLLAGRSKKVGKLALAIQIAFQELESFPLRLRRSRWMSAIPCRSARAGDSERQRNTELGRIASAPEDTLAANSEENDLTPCKSNCTSLA